MSHLLIQRYLNELRDLRKLSGTTRESVVREAFKDLLKGWGRAHDLVFVPEYEILTPAKERRYVDGALLHELRMPFGYWEAKDEKDDLDTEIETKFRRGYPRDNIIFEDSTHAVLIQNRTEVMRCSVEDVAELEKLLQLFFGYERPEVRKFRTAVEQFKTDLPAVLNELRRMIETAQRTNPTFAEAAETFLEHAHDAINPNLTDADVREMLIQHILTEEIFSKVFGEDDFHRQNNIAKALYALEATFFTGDLKKRTLRGLDAYYSAIRSAAAEISSHQQKQTFLKVIYENFYKVYNPKAADRLGVVYTPNEIVRFMIESADWLCEKHFGRNLIDPEVQILDPATGTGTFVSELLEHFRGQPKKLKHKYAEELHANEVAILPYYVANLNIEATYAAITGEYAEFKNLCFVDTLDNVAGLRKYAGHQHELFGSTSEENVERIKRQNRRKISVIIGNPPYNANQLNENENNRNREYPDIDKRIRETYIAASTAQKTKLYDMYARFFRWASDRVDENGIVAFVSNRSFIDSRTFDGFRDVIAREFNEIWVLDLGGDVRANPKLSGTKHNVFGIQTGVAISFLVKRNKAEGCRMFYARRPEMETAEEKLAFLGSTKIGSIPFEEIRPDASNNWINLAESDFGSLIPLATKAAKAAKRPTQEKAVFALFANGIKTNRDEWVYSFDRATLQARVAFFFAALKSHRAQHGKGPYDTAIKWSRDLKLKMARHRDATEMHGRFVSSLWRPFVKKEYWADRTLSDILTDYHFKFYGPELDATNPGFIFSVGKRGTPSVVATEVPPNYDMFVPNVGQLVCLYRFGQDGERSDNLTDWALTEFRKRYQPGRGKPARPLTKEAIFHYVYGVLHDPVFRQTYAVELSREFPRIPFYEDFWRWADWGKALMNLHSGYESVAPFPLKRIENSDTKADKAHLPPRPLLKADKEKETIALDTETTLAGIPREAWEYKVGSRSALEWILDQYSERKPKDPTIREKFNTFRFAEYKERVIDLVARITTVSVETVRITQAMRQHSGAGAVVTAAKG
jgi:predicted helicase